MMRTAVSGGAKARNGGKSAAAYRTISEVSEELDVPQHVLRFWETKFNQVRPLKRGGGRRYYRPEDVGLLRQIQKLLYQDGYTIKGVQRLLREGRTDQTTASAESDLLLDVGGLPLDEGQDEVIEYRAAGEGMRETAVAPAEAGAATAPPASALTPEVRAELRTLLAELKQLRERLHDLAKD